MKIVIIYLLLLLLILLLFYCDCIQVVVDNGKSDRITIIDNPKNMSAQLAITEYQVIKSSCHG